MIALSDGRRVLLRQMLPHTCIGHPLASFLTALGLTRSADAIHWLTLPSRAKRKFRQRPHFDTDPRLRPMDRWYVPLASICWALGRFALGSRIWMRGPVSVAAERGACGYSVAYKCLCECGCGGITYDPPDPTDETKKAWAAMRGAAYGRCMQCNWAKPPHHARSEAERLAHCQKAVGQQAQTLRWMGKGACPMSAIGEQLAAILEQADDALPQDPHVLLAIGHAAPNLGDFMDAVGQMLLAAAESEERAESQAAGGRAS